MIIQQKRQLVAVFFIVNNLKHRIININSNFRVYDAFLSEFLLFNTYLSIVKKFFLW